MKKFVLVVKVLILVSFFVIANITKLTEISLAAANGIAGAMAITTMVMYFVDSLIRNGKL